MKVLGTVILQCLKEKKEQAESGGGFETKQQTDVSAWNSVELEEASVKWGPAPELKITSFFFI